MTEQTSQMPRMQTCWPQKRPNRKQRQASSKLWNNFQQRTQHTDLQWSGQRRSTSKISALSLLWRLTGLIIGNGLYNTIISFDLIEKQIMHLFVSQGSPVKNEKNICTTQCVSIIIGCIWKSSVCETVWKCLPCTLKSAIARHEQDLQEFPLSSRN